MHNFVRIVLILLLQLDAEQWRTGRPLYWKSAWNVYFRVILMTPRNISLFASKRQCLSSFDTIPYLPSWKMLGEVLSFLLLLLKTGHEKDVLFFETSWKRLVCMNDIFYINIIQNLHGQGWCLYFLQFQFACLPKSALPSQVFSALTAVNCLTIVILFGYWCLEKESVAFMEGIYTSSSLAFPLRVSLSYCHKATIFLTSIEYCYFPRTLD